MPELYIAGGWRTSQGGARRTVRCPADGSLVAEVDEGCAADVADAVSAAREAFDRGPWPALSESERGTVVSTVADLIARDRIAFARAESLDTGKRLVEAYYDLDDVVSCFRYYAGIAGTDAGRVIDTGRADSVSRIVYEPLGVCALITPW
ncbi:MAG: betaine-aldehyde dehydrogenase, partial [Pseudonocardiales bacterium]|nr:betaine-aldehyde dehydrogenase [Pseudonocardiales bacterium]